MLPATRTILARDAQTTTVLTRGESLGLLLVTVAGLASALASTFVLSRIFRRIWKNGWSSLEALHISIMAMFVAEVLQGTGQAMNIKWVIEGKPHTGPFCTAQAVLSQLGEPYVALATMTIAFQTFFIVWRMGYISGKISACIMGIEFLFVVLFAAITFGTKTHPKQNKYYAAPIPYWCWIGNGFLSERIGGEYIWFWCALGFCLVLYIPLFLLYFGVIQRGARWYMPKASNNTLLTPSHSPSGGGSQVWSHSGAGRLPASQGISGASTEEQGTVPPIRENPRVLSTILYPIVYGFLVLPLSIVRWRAWSAPIKPLPNWPSLIVMTIFALSGVLDALLYLQTRRRLFQSEEYPDPLVAPGIKMTQLPKTN